MCSFSKKRIYNRTDKNGRKMKYKKIILGVALALACFSSLNANALTESKVKKTETQTAAPNVYWTDGYGRVSYTTNSIISPVVKIALKEFAGDMKAVTGFEAKEKNGAPIQIYQLDQLSNKEFSAVEKLGAPLHLIITGKDAFYIGTRKKKVIVIGSNARGTAYAIMKLSELAGVSPLMAWNDLQPAQRKSLYTPVDQQWIEVPRIEFRGLALNNSQWMKPQNYSRIARLMLRLRANTLWQVDGKHEAAYNKAVVDSFDICVAENYKVTEFVGKKHKKKHRKTIENVKLVCSDAQMEMSNLSPGLLLEMLNSKDYLESKNAQRGKSHRSEAHNDEDCAWIANITNPKLSTFQFAMMMNLAWNKNALKAGCKTYIQNTLNAFFGGITGRKIMPLMEEYYRLTSIRHSAYMAMPYGDTKFHSGEFGNELERFLYRYDLLKAKTESIERMLPQNQKDGFFEVVKYPIFLAAFVAEKELEAQEARHIARPGLFNKDDEAKAAAAVSIDAYNKLKQLNAYYSRIRNGKWKDFILTNGAEMQAPQIPGTLPAADIKRLKADAFDRSNDLKPLSVVTGDIIAKNAWEWSKATESPLAQAEVRGAEQITVRPLLGHSGKAVKLPKGASLSYDFYSDKSGDARFTIAVVPCFLNAVKDMRVSVSIDRGEPVICQLKEVYNSKDWKFDLWRGQTLKSFYVTLPGGSHNVTIKALDDNVMIDQWVLDYDVDREYYLFPVAK
jgi:hypothetical protein